MVVLCDAEASENLVGRKMRGRRHWGSALEVRVSRYPRNGQAFIPFHHEALEGVHGFISKVRLQDHFELP